MTDKITRITILILFAFTGIHGFSQQTEAGLSPQLFTLHGRNHYYQIPENPKGLVAVFPGCARGVFGFWPYSSNTKFYGLPEDVSHTKQILKMGYAILVMTPTDTKGLCWSLAAGDEKPAIDIIKTFQNKFGLGEKPLYFLGASSGGGLMQRIITRGNSIKVSGILAEVATTAAPSSLTPPAVWIVMTNPDEQAAAAGHVSLMKSYGKPAAMVVSPKRQVTAQFFAEQMAVINEIQSAQMATAIQEIGLIDSAGNFLANPKTYNWKDALNKKCPWLLNSPATTLKSTQTSGILQALTAAYAWHEHSAMFTTAILKWFEDGTPGSFNDYAEKYAVTRPAYFSLTDTLTTSLNYNRDISIENQDNKLMLAPNIFGQNSTIRYSLKASGKVLISAYSLSGSNVETLVNETQEKGFHEHYWNTSKLQNGFYLIKLVTSTSVSTVAAIKSDSQN